MKVNGQEFITIREMSKILGVPSNTIKQRLFQKNIKPVSKDALYNLSVLETIRNPIMGRPPKKAPKNQSRQNKKRYV